MIEGPEAFKRFDAMVDSLMAVPRKMIMRPEKAYRKKVAEPEGQRAGATSFASCTACSNWF